MPHDMSVELSDQRQLWHELRRRSDRANEARFNERSEGGLEDRGDGGFIGGSLGPNCETVWGSVNSARRLRLVSHDACLRSRPFLRHCESPEQS